MARKKFNMGKTLLALVVFVVIVLVPYFKTPKAIRNCELSGITMGTFYNVKIVAPALNKTRISSARMDVDKLLVDINNWMSTYIQESDISRFNSAGHTNAVPVSRELADVVRFSLDVAEKSGGAFDPTVGPLIELWGFGRKGPIKNIPEAGKVELVRSVTGHDNLHVDAGSTALHKDIASISLDLSAVAKGYGVDRVANLLLDAGYSNLLVEIGGEIMTLGYNDRKTPWRISIETPFYNSGIGQDRYRILSLSGKAVATSGDYRNYFEEAGKNYSHIIDPRIGWPVNNGVASVSVIADNCMTADALATALMVMGPEEGMKLLDQYPGAEAMFIIRNASGQFSDQLSKGFAAYVLNP